MALLRRERTAFIRERVERGLSPLVAQLSSLPAFQFPPAALFYAADFRHAIHSCMRAGKPRSSHLVPGSRDLVYLWGGLAILSLSISLFLSYSNQCVGKETAANLSYSIFPGILTEQLPAKLREDLSLRLNRRYCTCGCFMTLASCLNNHRSCRTSKQLSQEILDSIHPGMQPAHGQH